jgi:tripartite motif-containing protein 71
LNASAFRVLLAALSVSALAWVAQPPLRPQAQAAEHSSCRICFYGDDNIVFDAAGNIYIADSDHGGRSRVLKLSGDGRLILDWRLFHPVAGKRSGPEGIALDREGNLLVTDGGADTVLRLTPDGEIVGRIGGPGTFQDLGHVAADAAGNLYVAEAGPNRIQKFDASGKRIAVWQRTRGAGPDQWDGPETIAVRGDGSLAVEDWRNHRIVVLSSAGDTLFRFGASGKGPGQFARSAGLAVDSAGDIYVADDALHRVQEFSPSGRLLTAWPKPEGDRLFTSGPGGIALDAAGRLYAPDGETIVVFSRQGKALARWN